MGVERVRLGAIPWSPSPYFGWITESLSDEPPWGRGGAAKNIDWQMVSPIVFSCAARKNRWESSRARRPDGSRKGSFGSNSLVA